MPYRKLAEEILARWRAAERKLDTATGADAAALQAEMDELRTAYQRLIEDARAADREEPPPFPSRA